MFWPYPDTLGNGCTKDSSVIETKYSRTLKRETMFYSQSSVTIRGRSISEPEGEPPIRDMRFWAALL